MSKQNSVGTAKFKVNGVQYALAGEMRIMALEKKRTVLVGLDGSVAFQVEFQSPMLECQVRDRADVDLLAFNDMEGVTATVEMENGTAFEISDCSYTGDGELEVKEGTYQVRFNGTRVRRII